MYALAFLTLLGLFYLKSYYLRDTVHFLLAAIISCVALSPKHSEYKKDGESFFARMVLGSGRGRSGDEAV